MQPSWSNAKVDIIWYIAKYLIKSFRKNTPQLVFVPFFLYIFLSLGTLGTPAILVILQGTHHHPYILAQVQYNIVIPVP